MSEPTNEEVGDLLCHMCWVDYAEANPDSSEESFKAGFDMAWELQTWLGNYKQKKPRP